MHFLYNLLAVIIVIMAIPVFIVRLVRENGFGERLRQSFGFIPERVLAPVAGRQCIWLHAASVGEIVAASPIAKEIRRQFPRDPILVSVVTASGYAMAKSIISDADSVIFFPVDLPWLSHRVVSRIRPKVFLPVETELWPNFLKAARHFRIPVMMVNGRISDKSVKRYHYLHSVLNDMMDTVVKFCMQSMIDAQYVIRLGADPHRVVVTGNTKYDQTYTAVSQTEKQDLRRQLGLEAVGPVVVAGSTHKGEEEMLFTAFQQIRTQFSQARMIIAPRETMRSDEIIALAENYGFHGARRTRLQRKPAAGHDFVLLDTIGELGKIYSIGDIIYVGGSLVPHGGHNILEPAAHGKPIFVGPHMFNFKDTYALFSGRGACLTVCDTDELAEKMLQILNNEDERQAMSSKTLAIIEENRGAARKSVYYLKILLEEESIR
ncbi:MAG: 3-deoxy-D-manno-octulosonic acid transferase [Veillonellales bacterium]